MQRCLALTICANLRPARNISYSALLLEALNLSHTAYSILRHSSLSELRTRPTPHPLSFEDPSTYQSHVGVGTIDARDSSAVEFKSRDISPSSLDVSSNMKSVTT